MPTMVHRPSPHVGNPSGVPVDPDVAVGLFAAEQDLAEVLELGLIRIGVVGDRARHDLGGVGAGEVEELVDLVRADIDQDAAGIGAPEEPVGAQVAIEPVRPEPTVCTTRPIAPPAPARSRGSWPRTSKRSRNSPTRCAVSRCTCMTSASCAGVITAACRP